ncbi:MAG: leucine-rich repeat domain-containing protein [Ruminococcaceae bacterium]|nr:leucine-rich repeat domain-containing protein [Oscillospiraceae bacterium]
MKFSKKIIAVVLTVLMVVSVLPFSAFAATSGSCGTNATYTLQDTDEDSILDKLTISGTGAMADYTSGGAPWYSYSERQNLKTVVIEEGITSVGNYAFFNLDHAISLSIASTVETLGTSSFQYYGYYSTNVLTNVTLPDALTNIGDRAFAGWKSLQSVTIPAGVTSIGSQTFAGCSALSTVTFARPSTSHNLAVGVSAFSSGSIAFSGTGADLYDGETEITAGTAASSLGGKTLNWVSTTPVLPQATVTDITNSEENTIGLDAAFKFVAPEGTTAYDDYYCDFKISFDRDLTSDDIELWGQYGNYPWTNLASEASGDAYTIEKDTDYYLLRDIIQAPMTYAQIREIETFLCGIKSHYGAAGATINVQLVLFDDITEVNPITLDEKVFVAPTEPNNGANITVADTISENFYLDDEFYGESAYVSVNYNHNSNASETADFRTDVQSMASLPELDDNESPYDGARKLSVIQAPAQSTEPITIKVYATQADAQAGTNAIDTIEYSVYNYCRQILEGEYAENLKELAESTLDYAAAAQTYFNYNTDNMATVDATGDFYNNVAGADLSSVAGVSAAPSCIKRASIVVKSDLEINLYSLTPIEVTGYSIDSDNAERFTATTGEKNGDYYCVHISGIDAANMNKTFTVNTSEGDIVMTANTVIKMMAGSSNANLSTLAKAMYLYGVAASEYFG